MQSILAFGRLMQFGPLVRGGARRLGTHLFAALAVALLLTLPDHLYQLANPAYKVAFDPDEFGALVVVAFLVVAIRRAWLLAGALAFFGLLQLSQLLHFAYFGSLIAPHAVGLFFQEQGEIWQSLLGVAPYMLMPVSAVAVAYAAIVWLWRKTHRQTLNLLCPSLILLALLPIMPMKAYGTAKPQKFYPNPKSTSLKNTYYAVSFFLGKDLPEQLSGKPPKTYLPYQVIKHAPPGPINIVVVMGESLGYSHMSLFGYERSTTPRLESLKGDPGFVYHRAIAGGISTKASLPLFFNIQREPDNVQHMFRYESNLMKMAKAQGLATHYISNQTSHLSTYSGTEYADHYLTKENMEPLYRKEYDAALVTALKRIDLAKSNFIVLHQRNAHSPYHYNYPPAFERYPTANLDRYQFTVNTYDNAVGFTDHVLHEIIQTVKQRSKVPTYVFFTADHGELIGEDGKYGHAMLEPGVAAVPFILYAHRGDAGKIAQFRAMQHPSHYEIGKAIARVLGYEVVNPNEKDGVFYINGANLDGSAGYLAYTKGPGTNVLRVE